MGKITLFKKKNSEQMNLNSNIVTSTKTRRRRRRHKDENDSSTTNHVMKELKKRAIFKPVQPKVVDEVVEEVVKVEDPKVEEVIAESNLKVEEDSGNITSLTESSDESSLEDDIVRTPKKVDFEIESSEDLPAENSETVDKGTISTNSNRPLYFFNRAKGIYLVALVSFTLGWLAHTKQIQFLLGKLTGLTGVSKLISLFLNH